MSLRLAQALLCVFLSGFGCCVTAGETGVTANGVLIGLLAPCSGPNGVFGLDMTRVI